MRLPLSRAVLTIVMLVTSAARLHSHTVNPPDAMMQEINRCLGLVKIVASRKQSSRPPDTVRFRPDAVPNRLA